MKERFSDAQVGDKVYDRVYGFGEIVEFDSTWGKGLCIRVALANERHGPRAKLPFSLKGEHYYNAAEPTLFYVDGDNKYATERPKPKVPWNKVPVDTKIFVGCRKRHHAGNKFFFLYGCTSHTANSNDIEATTSPVTLAEEVTIDGITYPIGSE